MRGVAYTPDGALVTVGVDGTLRVTGPPGTPERRRVLPGRELRTDPAVSPDGRWIAAVSSDPVGGDGPDDRVHVWETATLDETATVPLDDVGASSPAFGPDGRRLAVAVGDGIRMWRFGGGTLTGDRTVRSRQGGQGAQDGRGRVRTLAYSPDGRLLATAGDGGRIVVRDAATAEPVREVARRHPSTIRDVVFSPDGSMLASGAVDDSTLRVWEVDTGRLLANLTGHVGPPNDVAFSPDGSLLAGASRDTAVSLWPLDPADAVAALCEDLTHTGGPEALCADPG